MKRRIYQKLLAWKASNNRKPLILKGARQVGKTYILNEFGSSEYEQVIAINFDEVPAMKSFFEEDLNPERIIKELEVHFKQPILPGKHLIIFDEIQECPNAINALKYFCEKTPGHHVVAAGSLLGVKLSKGFPVGKVNFLKLYPMNFFEFLEAIGEDSLCELLEKQASFKPLTDIFHNKLTKLLKYYFVVGGMPEAVALYQKHHDVNGVREIQRDILDTYVLDFAKHAPKEELARIMSVWDFISPQLAKENKKFIFTAISKSARAVHYESAIQWLVDAGLIYKCYNISTPSLPIDAYANKNIFKVYMLDVGLLGAQSRLDPRVVLEENALFKEFKGALTENFVAQELSLHHDENLYYWTSAGTAEVDFVLPYQNAIYPLEVKAGISKKKKSLLVYGEKYSNQQGGPKLLSRASLRNFALDDHIANYPLYAIAIFPELTAGASPRPTVGPA